MSNYWKLRLAIFAITSVLGLAVKLAVLFTHHPGDARGNPRTQVVANQPDEEEGDEEETPVVKKKSVEKASTAPAVAQNEGKPDAPKGEDDWPVAPAVAQADEKTPAPTKPEPKTTPKGDGTADEMLQAATDEASKPKPKPPAPVTPTTPPLPPIVSTVPTPLPAPPLTPPPFTPPAAMPAPPTNPTPTNPTPSSPPATRVAAMPAATPANPAPPAPPTGNDAFGDFPPGFGPPLRGAEDFLAALRARDLDALAEATALRAPTEANSLPHQKLFKSILDKSLSDDDLKSLADMFEGFTVFDVMAGPSTGRVNVILDKVTEFDEYNKTIVMRKEKAGWKIMDYTPTRSFNGGKPKRLKTRR